MQINNPKDLQPIGVIGLGYVGLPLALGLAKHFDVIGYDISKDRIDELQNNLDRNKETSTETLKLSKCRYSNNLAELANCKLYIITVPTPVDKENRPDLSILKSASEALGKILKKGDIVVYESTVYPGVTEGLCGHTLANSSGLQQGKDFYLGYSPERINPGDNKHTVETITKVVAGETPQVTDLLAKVYGSINHDNIFKATSIKVAEAAKAIENAQRDINIAFINEVALISNKLGISVYDVLDAAKTKWNFLNFVPGLVGGHCIGVDPYYLAECAQGLGLDPNVILSGRKINDDMGKSIATACHDQIANLREPGQPTDILVLGFTFKENITDIRNTKTVDLINELEKLGHNVTTHDAYASADHATREYNIQITNELKGQYDAVILAVPHQEYTQMEPANIATLLKPNGLVFDLKGTWRHHTFPPAIRYLPL